MPTHKRIRMFNTRETYPNQSLDNDLCQAVVAGNTVYVRGQIGTDFDGNLIGLGDPAAQAEQAMQNVKQLLDEAGSDLSHIVKTTTYITDPRFREPVYQVVGKWRIAGKIAIATDDDLVNLGLQPIMDVGDEWLAMPGNQSLVAVSYSTTGPARENESGNPGVCSHLMLQCETFRPVTVFDCYQLCDNSSLPP